MTGNAIIYVSVRESDDLPLLKDTDHFKDALMSVLRGQQMADEVEVDAVDFIGEAEKTLLHLTCEPDTDANYAKKGNAIGLKTDLAYSMRGGLDTPEWFHVEADVLRGTFCDHPEAAKERRHDDSAPIEGGAEWVKCTNCDETLPEHAQP
jgi:hypothetical protein